MLRKASLDTRRFGALLLLKFDSFPQLKQVTSCRRSFTSICTTKQSRDDHLVESTKKWIDLLIVGEKLCPFALPLINSDAIRIVSSTAQSAAEATKDVAVELDLLLRPKMGWKNDIEKTNGLCDGTYNHGEKNRNIPSHETTLIAFDGDFVRNFHEFVRLSWTLQSDAVVAGGFNHDVQLVLFHPAAKHQTYGTDEPDGNATDYTIRSPYPLIHLLREVDVMRAVSGRYPNLADLPSRNKQKMVAQGLSFCKNRLLDCYIPKKPGC